MSTFEIKLFFVYFMHIILITYAGASWQSAAFAQNVTQTDQVLALLEAIQRERNFETIVFMSRNHKDRFVSNSVYSRLNMTPTLILSADQPVYLKGNYSLEMLIVACLNTHIDTRLLNRMADNLQHMRSTRTLLLLRNFMEHGNSLERIFQHCSQLRMLNVLAIFENFALHGQLYSFTQYPKFKIQLKSKSDMFYPNPVKNLHRAKLFSLPSGYEPYSMLYVDKRGARRNFGYLYHLVSSFADKLNATLTYKYPVGIDDYMETSVLANLTSHYALDVPMCLDTPFVQSSLFYFSDIVEITTWMPMIPKSNYLETYKFYLSFTSSYELLLLDALFYFSMSLLHSILASRCGKRAFNFLDCILNDKVMRALLGQPFKLVRQPSYQLRITYILLLLQSNIRSTLFSAYLDALFTHPPSEAQINSFDDFKRTGTKILIPSSKFQLLLNLSTPEFIASYGDIFQTISNVHEFQALRKSLNTEFAYSTHSANWALFHKQQKYFYRHLFRISESVTFRRFLLMAVPMAENSIYRDAFNRFIGEMHSCGLWHRWNIMNFYEMVEAGKMSFEDLSTRRSYEQLTVKDFYYVWILLFLLLGIATASCVVEKAIKQF